MFEIPARPGADSGTVGRLADFEDAYAAKLRARLVAVVAAAEEGEAPHPVVAQLRKAIEELDARGDVKPGWAALDVYRAWRMGSLGSSGSSTPPT